MQLFPAGLQRGAFGWSDGVLDAWRCEVSKAWRWFTWPHVETVCFGEVKIAPRAEFRPRTSFPSGHLARQRRGSSTALSRNHSFEPRMNTDETRIKDSSKTSPPSSPNGESSS